MTALIDAWQAALAAEQEAVFGYQLLGPHLPQRDQARALAAETAHTALRDATAQGLIAAGESPVATAADYPGLYPVDTGAAALALTSTLEGRCAAAWRFYYGQLALNGSEPADSTTLTQRRSAQAALTASAVRGTQWRVIARLAPVTTAFPGI